MIGAVEMEKNNGSELEKKRSEEDRKPWLSLLQRIWALGPRHIGPNILLYSNLPIQGGDIKGLGVVSDGDTWNAELVLVCGSPHILENLDLLEVLAEKSTESASIFKESDRGNDLLNMEAESLQSSVVSSFQLATTVGPLCDEPMRGLAFLMEAYIFPRRNMSLNGSDSVGENVDKNELPEQYGPFSG